MMDKEVSFLNNVDKSMNFYNLDRKDYAIDPIDQFRKNYTQSLLNQEKGLSYLKDENKRVHTAMGLSYNIITKSLLT